jgi:hypothetical protein
MGSTNSTEKGVVLAIIAHEVDPVNPVVLTRKVADDIPAPVSAAVIYEDQFLFEVA